MNKFRFFLLSLAGGGLSVVATLAFWQFNVSVLLPVLNGVVLTLMVVFVAAIMQSNSDPQGQDREEIPDRQAGLGRRLAGSVGQNAVSAAEVSFSTDQLRQRLERKAITIGEIADNAMEITANVQQAANAAVNAVATAESARQISMDGQRILQDGIAGMRRINSQTEATLEQIGTLDTRVHKIQDVTSVIEEIASQTNLLALNAAIEAARAGEHGRGFAVVADEVRHLAARTADSTGEVANIVNEILSETQGVVGHIQALSADVEKGTQDVENVGAQLEGIAGQTADTESCISSIADGIENSRTRLEAIADSIAQVRVDARENEKEVERLSAEAEKLMVLAEEANAVLAETTADSYHQPFFQVAQRTRDDIQQAFEDAITGGRISANDLFDETYTPIANTNPVKYNTRFDEFCDRVLPDIQEKAVAALPKIVFAISCDRRGYVPTHNRKFCQPLTGDPKVDLVSNRTKRIFDDRTGARCGSHTNNMLLQTYKRDTGEIMHDLSVPIYVQGRHWGGLRVGYQPE